MLTKIVAQTRDAVTVAKESRPLSSLLNGLQPATFAFSVAIAKAEWALIAECKLASPAKGLLCTNYSVPELAQIFVENGATALSVHTNRCFHGSLADIGFVRKTTGLPILRKDFIIDHYQLYEARAAGADAVLLIAAILTDLELKEFLYIANQLGMDCLVEVHSREELDRVQHTQAQLIGINNRNLNTFATDIEQTFALLPYCEPHRRIISESGIKTGHDACRLKTAGVCGILVGEGLVTADDIAFKTRELALI